MPDDDQAAYVTFYGDTVKSLGENRIGGRIVTYSGPSDPDKVKDFFDGSSDFWLNGTGERRPILYRHGLDPVIKRRRFGEVQISRGSDGLWATGYIAGKDDDSLKLLDMARRGELNWSTGSVGHLVEKTPVGDSMHVDSWPIAECTLSLKDLVCEARNIVSLKELSSDVPNFHALLTRSPFSQSAEHDAHLQAKVDHELRKFEELQREIEKTQREIAERDTAKSKDLEERAQRKVQEFYNMVAGWELAKLERMISLTAS